MTTYLLLCVMAGAVCLSNGISSLCGVWPYVEPGGRSNPLSPKLWGGSSARKLSLLTSWQVEKQDSQSHRHRALGPGFRWLIWAAAVSKRVLRGLRRKRLELEWDKSVTPLKMCLCAVSHQLSVRGESYLGMNWSVSSLPENESPASEYIFFC